MLSWCLHCVSNTASTILKMSAKLGSTRMTADSSTATRTSTRRTRSGRSGSSRVERNVEPPPEPEAPALEVIVDLCSPLEDESSCIDLTCDAEVDVVDLTAVNDSPVVLLGPGTSVQRRTRAPKRKRPLAQVEPEPHSDDLPDLPVFEVQVSSKNPGKSAKPDSRRLSSPTKKIVCPICLDEINTIQLAKRQLVSTICGHIFCNVCIDEAIRAQRACPTCRKKLTLKQFHPIFL